MSVAPQFYHLDNRLLAALPPDIFTALERDLADVTLEQGTVLYESGDPIERVYFPQTGVVSLVIVTGGQMLEISTIGREGAVGFQRGLGTRLAFARTTVQNTGRFSVIGAARFEQIVGQSAAARDPWTALKRLTESAQMGDLFKVFCAHSPGLVPPGFA